MAVTVGVIQRVALLYASKQDSWLKKKLVALDRTLFLQPANRHVMKKAKTIRTIYPKQQLLYCLLTLVVLLLSQVTASAANHPSTRNDTIVINKSQTSKKYKIRIYPSATNEVLFFTASGESGKVYQLYVFDMDGKLVKQTQIHNKETTLLANFVKGNYMFDVFSDDEKIENGTLVVR